MRAYEIVDLMSERASASGVQLVRVDIDLAAPLHAADFNVLCAEERTTAARMRRQTDGVRSAATRSALRFVMSEQLGLSPSSLRFYRNRTGKPCLVLPVGRSKFDFNVSHSGEHALIAWIPAGRIGVDIERCEHNFDWSELVDWVLTADEALYLFKLPDIARREAFYRVWSAKEAVLKGLGTGLIGGAGKAMSSFSIMSRDAGEDHQASAFDIEWIKAADGYAACVAWAS